jgi:hypothetical protein
MDTKAERLLEGALRGDLWTWGQVHPAGVDRWVFSNTRWEGTPSRLIATVAVKVTRLTARRWEVREVNHTTWEPTPGMEPRELTREEIVWLRQAAWFQEGRREDRRLAARRKRLKALGAYGPRW